MKEKIIHLYKSFFRLFKTMPIVSTNKESTQSEIRSALYKPLLVYLCTKHKINFKEFTEFHYLYNTPKVNYGIIFFDLLKAKFEGTKHNKEYIPSFIYNEFTQSGGLGNNNLSKQQFPKELIDLLNTNLKRKGKINTYKNNLLEKAKNYNIDNSLGKIPGFIDNPLGSESYIFSQAAYTTFVNDKLLELDNLVTNYEFLLDQAKIHNINWDSKNYDPVTLQQLIDNAKHKEVQEKVLQHYTHLADKLNY